jgi:hypothetical protein
MIIQRAVERLRKQGSVPVLAAALLLAAGSAWAGGHQDRSGARSGSSGGGGGRTAVPSSPSSSPSSGGGSWGQSSSSHGSSSGRTGVPIGSNDRGHGPNRQPPTQHRHGGGGHGGYYGGYYGGYGYPYYYPYYGGYYGWGYWPRSFWGWYWDDYYWRDGYGYGYPYPHRYGSGRYDRDDMGALDLDISPGRTQVFLDGQSVGTVDEFDGWPQYLWLPRGTYDIAFYLDGYQTLARQVTVYPGLVIDMDDRLEPGQSTRPEDLQTKTHERRDDRLRYERERSDRIDRGEWDARRRDDDNWRGRAPRRDRDEADREDDDNGRTEEQAEMGSDVSHGSDAGWVRFDVDPEDASVYLDGRFVGTGTELSSLQRGLKVDPGKHHLAVVRPGRRSEEKDFQVTAGQETKLSVDLDRNSE